MSKDKSFQDFVPYELSLDLKELGFNEPCFGLYAPPSKTVFLHHYGLLTAKEQVLAPLWQQAFKWFREKYDVYHFVTREVGINTSDIFFVASYYKGKKGNSPKDTCASSRTYQEAELECLVKLIEIVKSQKSKSIVN